MDDIDYVVLSDISEINPPTDMHGLDDNTFVSFIPMADVSESGEWINQQARVLKDVRNGYTYFQEGDILFAKITPCMENGKGAHAVNLLNGIGFGTTEFHVLRAKSCAHPRFIYHWIMNEELRRKAEARMTGSAGQRRVPASFFGEFKVPFLPLSEQRRIAEILDTIDEAIQKTEALISKLKAMKQGLLHDLLTRGLDKNGKLRDPKAHPEQFKDSPLGKIPKEWQVVSIGKISRVRRGASPRPIDNPVWFAQEGKGWIRISDVTRANGLLKETEQYLSPAGVNKSVSVYPGQIIMSICATIGEPIILDMNACIHDGFVVFDRYDEFMCPEFFIHFLRSKQSYFRSQRQTGTQANLNTNIVKDCFIGLPILTEQKNIAKCLDSHDARIRTEEQYRDKLKLQKKGLMYDLLTGRVRVKM